MKNTTTQPKTDQKPSNSAKTDTTSTKLSIPISSRFSRPNPLAGGNSF